MTNEKPGAVIQFQPRQAQPYDSQAEELAAEKLIYTQIQTVLADIKDEAIAYCLKTIIDLAAARDDYWSWRLMYLNGIFLEEYMTRGDNEQVNDEFLNAYIEAKEKPA